jgi:hypothetical protein
MKKTRKTMGKGISRTHKVKDRDEVESSREEILLSCIKEVKK